MMKGIRFLFAVFAILVIAGLASGCARIIVKRGIVTNPPQPKEATVSKTAAGVVLGIEPVTKPFVLNQICPNGWDEIVTEARALESALRIVTLTMYSPTRATVTCLGPKPAPVED